jgi:hypothetical protein
LPRWALIPTNHENDIRNIPVRDMINFLPMDEVKKEDHFIYALKIENQWNKAKVSQEMEIPILAAKICFDEAEEDFEVVA